MEALQLHTLETIIKKKNGIIFDRNTDAIRYGREEAIDITHYYWDDEKTVMKYQCEIAKPLEVEVLPRLCKTHQLDYNVFCHDIRIRNQC